MHHLARIGYLRRLAERRPAAAPPPEGEETILTILVPAYKEEPAVVRKTLLSAALQEAGPRLVVLLIDDPPSPASAADRHALFAARREAVAVAGLLADLSRPAATAAAAFARRDGAGGAGLAAECQVLGALYRHAAEWFEEQARPYRQGDHADRFFAETVLGELGRRMIARAEAWHRRAAGPAVDRTGFIDANARHAANVGGFYDFTIVSSRAEQARQPQTVNALESALLTARAAVETAVASLKGAIEFWESSVAPHQPHRLRDREGAARDGRPPRILADVMAPCPVILLVDVVDDLHGHGLQRPTMAAIDSCTGRRRDVTAS